MLILEGMTMHQNILQSKSSLHVSARSHCLLVHNKLPVKRGNIKGKIFTLGFKRLKKKKLENISYL